MGCASEVVLSPSWGRTAHLLMRREVGEDPVPHGPVLEHSAAIRQDGPRGEFTSTRIAVGILAASGVLRGTPHEGRQGRGRHREAPWHQKAIGLVQGWPC